MVFFLGRESVNYFLGVVKDAKDSNFFI